MWLMIVTITAETMTKLMYLTASAPLTCLWTFNDMCRKVVAMLVVNIPAERPNTVVNAERLSRR
jgi:hypothetical protein